MSYLLASLAFAALLGKTIIDWPEHKKDPWKFRGDVALLTLGLVVMVVTIAKTVRDNKSVAEDKAAALKKEQQATAQKQADDARLDQTKKDFKSELDTILKQVQTVAVTARTQELLDQIAAIRSHVGQLKMQADKSPEPKPRLVGGFPPYNDDKLSTEIHTHRVNGVVSFQVSVANMSDVTAQRVVMSVSIPKGCSYVREPKGSRYIPGNASYDREFDFQLPVPGQTGVEAQTIDLTLPATATGPVELHPGVRAWCDNCGPSENPDLTVYVDD